MDGGDDDDRDADVGCDSSLGRMNGVGSGMIEGFSESEDEVQ